MIIAIQPDDYTNPATGNYDASSPRWAQLLLEAGYKVRWVDVHRPDILEQVKGCDGFMWRHGHLPEHRQIARRLLPVIENELGLVVYPDQHTCWHYDDKISQYYLLSAAGIPMPKTWVWFDYEQTVEWINSAEFPLVMKLWTGAASENVRLVKNLNEAKLYIDRVFREGIANMNEFTVSPLRSFYRRLRLSAKILLNQKVAYRPWELHKNYVLFQEFLSENYFDTRVVVIGNRVFAKRRYNRRGDFRASGSGNLDNDPMKIDLKIIRLAFRVSERLRTQSLALDILKRKKEYVVSEISYTYPSWSQHSCPGHWELEENKIIWKAGHMWPEEAQIEDFLVRLEKRRFLRDEICV
jgi:glutathione synthase/RimK-type ligase-like ATP-grasp enzyme